MKSTACFFTVCIVCSTLPLMMQGAELLEDHPSKKPKAQNRSIHPVIIEIESGMIKLLFTRNLGEVIIEMQNTDDTAMFREAVDSSIQYQTTIILPTDTYILTVTAADGTILIEKYIVIP